MGASVAHVFVMILIYIFSNDDEYSTVDYYVVCRTYGDLGTFDGALLYIHVNDDILVQTEISICVEIFDVKI